MSKTQLFFVAMPMALLLALVLAHLIRVFVVMSIRMWFLENDYQAYKRLPSFDEMSSKHWMRWSLASWQGYVRGLK